MSSQRGTNKLIQMQMKFQQKQREGRERNEHNANKINTASSDEVKKDGITSISGPGKVRQISPLKPIGSKLVSNSNPRVAKTVAKEQHTLKQVNINLKNSSSSTGSAMIQRRIDIQCTNKGIRNDEVYEESIAVDKVNLSETRILQARRDVKNSIKTKNENEVKRHPISDCENNNSISTLNNSNLSVKPVLKKRVAVATKSLQISNKNPSPSLSKYDESISHKKEIKSISPPETNLKTSATTKFNEDSKVSGNDKKGSNIRVTKNNVDSNLVACRVCGRNFDTSRIEKHESICEKTKIKKRKKYDPVKHRVAGTDAEKYLRKTKKVQISTASSSTSKLKTNSSENANNTGKLSNWRKTHEEFVKAIRAAREMQAHLKKGGKLSDLPPPPASENLDYIQCPHCSRKFNKSAAERHIPKCANFRHNKVKPNAATSRKKL